MTKGKSQFACDPRVIQNYKLAQRELISLKQCLQGNSSCRRENWVNFVRHQLSVFTVHLIPVYRWNTTVYCFFQRDPSSCLMMSLLIWLGVVEDRFEGLPIIFVLALLVSSIELISLVKSQEYKLSYLVLRKEKMTASSNRQILIIQRTLCFSLSKAWRGHILRTLLSIIVH